MQPFRWSARFVALACAGAVLSAVVLNKLQHGRRRIWHGSLYRRGWKRPAIWDSHVYTVTVIYTRAKRESNATHVNSGHLSRRALTPVQRSSSELTLIPFLPFPLNRLGLPTPELDPIPILAAWDLRYIASGRTPWKTRFSIIKDACLLVRYLAVDVILLRARVLRECVYLQFA
jgi:hypothetical protein